jgi:Flp pilus assembly protein TadG
LVETALILLGMLLLMLATFDGAYAIWSYTTLCQAARQGARFAQVHGTANPSTDDAIRDQVRDWSVGLNRANVQVLTTWIPNREIGSEVQVRATYNLQLMVSPLVFSSSTLALGTTARATVTY